MREPLPPDSSEQVGFVLKNSHGDGFFRYQPYTLLPVRLLRDATVFATLPSAIHAIWNAAQRNGEGRVRKEPNIEQHANVGAALTILRVKRVTRHEVEEIFAPVSLTTPTPTRPAAGADLPEGA